MSRIMKALIAENQPAPLASFNTATIYRNIGDAINAVCKAACCGMAGEDGEPVSITMDRNTGGWEVDAPNDYLDRMHVYEIGCYAIIGYVFSWRLTDGSIAYTAVKAFA